MRYQSKFGLVAAMEAEDEIAAVAASNKVGEHAESVETDLLDVGDAETEIDDEEKKTEEAVDVMNALESLVVALEASIEHGGISKDAAAMLSIATDHMYSKVGITKKSIPALESFGNEVNRIQATKLAIEGFSNTASKIWEAIINAIKKSIQMIKDFFSRIFGVNQKNKERCDKLQAKVKEAIVEEHKEPTKQYKTVPERFENSSINNVLMLPKDFKNSVDKLMSNYHDLSKSILSCKSGLIDTELVTVMQRFMKGEKQRLYESFVFPVVDFPTIKMTTNKFYTERDSSKYTESENRRHEEYSRDIVNVESEKTFGELYIQATLPKPGIKGERGIYALEKFYLGIGKTVITENYGVSYLDVLTLAQCESILKTVSDVNGYIEKSNSIIKDVEAYKRKIISLCEDVTKKEDGDSFSFENNENKRLITALIKKITTFGDQPIRGWAKDAVVINYQLMTYVNLCVGHHLG